MYPVSLRYSKVLSISCLVVGILLFVVALLTAEWFSMLPAVILGLLGTLMLVNPMFVVHDGEAQMRSPLGFTTRRHPVTGPADLRAESKRLVHVPTGKKVASLGFGVDKGDVQRLRSSVPGN
ncbi:MAG: hypothetical protein L0H93_16170 [Nocardioides sp.]|nr:hypothetical protein [Nocardioides sp.]